MPPHSRAMPASSAWAFKDAASRGNRYARTAATPCVMAMRLVGQIWVGLSETIPVTETGGEALTEKRRDRLVIGG